jgi:hypothetical protein
VAAVFEPAVESDRILGEAGALVYSKNAAAAADSARAFLASAPELFYNLAAP